MYLTVHIKNPGGEDKMDENSTNEIRTMKDVISDYVVSAISSEKDDQKINTAATLIYCYIELSKLENASPTQNF